MKFRWRKIGTYGSCLILGVSWNITTGHSGGGIIMGVLCLAAMAWLPKEWS